MNFKEEEYINFDQFAEFYDTTRSTSEQLLKLFLASFLEVNNDDNSLKNILEIGCGTGRISRIFAINNFWVTGVDVSTKMLDQALSKAKEEKWSFKGIVSDSRNLPFKKDEFDIAYTVDVLHVIKDWKKVIQEALRCSKNRFVNVNLEKSIFGTELLKNYWKFISDKGITNEYQTNTKLGAQNAEEVAEYMKSLNYTYIKKEFKNNTYMKREELIKIAKLKTFSSQRFIPLNIHQEAVNYLEKNDYFLPDKENIDIIEKGTIYSFR